MYCSIVDESTWFYHGFSPVQSISDLVFLSLFLNPVNLHHLCLYQHLIDDSRFITIFFSPEILDLFYVNEKQGRCSNLSGKSQGITCKNIPGFLHRVMYVMALNSIDTQQIKISYENINGISVSGYKLNLSIQDMTGLLRKIKRDTKIV